MQENNIVLLVFTNLFAILFCSISRFIHIQTLNFYLYVPENAFLLTKLIFIFITEGTQ